MSEPYNIPISIEPRGFTDAARQTKALGGEFENFARTANKVAGTMKNLSAAILGGWSVKELAHTVSDFNKVLYDLSRASINTGQSFSELNMAISDISTSTKYSKQESLEFVKSVNQMTAGAKLSGSELSRLATVIDTEYSGSLQAASGDLQNLMNIQNKFTGVIKLVNNGLNTKDIAAYSTMLRMTYGATEDQITSFQRMAKASKEGGSGLTDTEKKLRGLTDNMQKFEKAKADTKLDFGKAGEEQLTAMYATMGKLVETLKEIPDSIKRIGISFSALAALPALTSIGATGLGNTKGIIGGLQGFKAPAAAPAAPAGGSRFSDLTLNPFGTTPTSGKRTPAEVSRSLRSKSIQKRGMKRGKAGLLSRAASFAQSGVASQQGVIDVRVVGISSGVQIPGLKGGILPDISTLENPFEKLSKNPRSILNPKALSGKTLGKGITNIGKSTAILSKTGLGSRAVGAAKSLGSRALSIGKGGGPVGIIATLVGGIVGDKLEEAGMKKTGAGIRAASNIGGMAMTGAAIGSAIPGIGTAIGTIAGAAVGVVTSFDDIGTVIGGAYDSVVSWTSSLWLGADDIEKATNALAKNFAYTAKMTGSWGEKFDYFWQYLTGQVKDEKEFTKKQLNEKQAKIRFENAPGGYTGSAAQLKQVEEEAARASLAQKAGGDITDPKTLVQEFARMQLIKQAADKSGYTQEYTNEITKAVEDGIAKGSIDSSKKQETIDQILNERLAQLSADLKKGSAPTSVAQAYGEVSGREGAIEAATETARQQVGGYAQSIAAEGQSADIIPADVENKASAAAMSVRALKTDLEQIQMINNKQREDLDAQIQLASQYNGNVNEAVNLIRQKAELAKQELARYNELKKSTYEATQSTIVGLKQEIELIRAGKTENQLTGVEKDKIRENQKTMNALLEGQLQIQAGISKSVKEKYDLISEEANANQGIIDLYEAQYQSMEAQFNLAKDMYMGFSVGLDMQAELYAKSKQIENNLQNRVKILKEALKTDEKTDANSAAAIKTRKDLAQAETAVTQQKQKQLDLTKHIREGYLDAMMASSNAEGMFSKLLLTRENGMSKLMDRFEAAQGPSVGILGEGAKAPVMGYSREGLVIDEAEDRKTAARMRKPIEDVIGKMLPNVFVPDAVTSSKMIMGGAGDVPFSNAQQDLPNLEQYQKEKRSLEETKAKKAAGAVGAAGAVPGLATGTFRDDMIEAINKTIGGSITLMASGSSALGPAGQINKDIKEATQKGTQQGAQAGAKEGSEEGSAKGTKQGSNIVGAAVGAAVSVGSKTTEEMMASTKNFQEKYLSEQIKQIPELGNRMKKVIDPVRGMLSGVVINLGDVSDSIDNMSKENTIGSDANIRDLPEEGENEPAGFAKGGMVPGIGNRDNVPAYLTPGEVVWSKKAVQNNPEIAKFAEGGKVSTELKFDPNAPLYGVINEDRMYKQRRAQEKRMAELDYNVKAQDENRGQRIEVSKKWRESKEVLSRKMQEVVKASGAKNWEDYEKKVAEEISLKEAQATYKRIKEADQLEHEKLKAMPEGTEDERKEKANALARRGGGTRSPEFANAINIIEKLTDKPLTSAFVSGARQSFYDADADDLSKRQSRHEVAPGTGEQGKAKLAKLMEEYSAAKKAVEELEAAEVQIKEAAKQRVASEIKEWDRNHPESTAEFEKLQVEKKKQQAEEAEKIKQAVSETTIKAGPFPFAIRERQALERSQPAATEPTSAEATTQSIKDVLGVDVREAREAKKLDQEFRLKGTRNGKRVPKAPQTEVPVVVVPIEKKKQQTKQAEKVLKELAEIAKAREGSMSGQDFLKQLDAREAPKDVIEAARESVERQAQEQKNRASSLVPPGNRPGAHVPPIGAGSTPAGTTAAEARKKQKDDRFAAYKARISGTPEQIKRRQDIAASMKAKMGEDVLKIPTGKGQDSQTNEWKSGVTGTGKLGLQGTIRQASQSRGKTMYQFQRKETEEENKARKQQELYELAYKTAGSGATISFKPGYGGFGNEEEKAVSKAQSERSVKNMEQAKQAMMREADDNESNKQSAISKMEEANKTNYENLYGKAPLALSSIKFESEADAQRGLTEENGKVRYKAPTEGIYSSEKIENKPTFSVGEEVSPEDFEREYRKKAAAEGQQVGGPKGLWRQKGFAEGDIVPGTGSRDVVPAMLTPGEFVVRKSSAEKNMSILKQINSGRDMTQSFSEGGHVFMNTFSPIIPSPAIGMNSGGQVTSFSNTFNVKGGNFGKMMGEISSYLSEQWQYPHGGTGRRASI